MATRIETGVGMTREHKFFLTMACVMAVVIVAGFSARLAMGLSSFNSPLLVHVHAFVFFGFVVLYLLQNALVATGSVAMHKRLGWLALAWLPAMAVLGVMLTLHSIRRGGPPFFDQNEFLFGNPAQLFCFVGLAIAAILMRRRTDWHRRLMYCGMAILTGPGLGRLLPMPYLIPWAWWVVFAFTLIFPLIGILGDLKRTGRAHPAWFWALAATFSAQLIGDLIAYSPWGIAMTEQVIAGTPGAERGMEAYFP